MELVVGGLVGQLGTPIHGEGGKTSLAAVIFGLVGLTEQRLGQRGIRFGMGQ